ncbi:DUF4178 domain-containing protein [Comamonas composti]|uniref:DUF4178 domain-containing protein n=1 Tax=Comamonas composti TaxID=408558 RepID=UPI000424AB6D|nr:DUF4178 domain-containing protein [Comamonas composti]
MATSSYERIYRAPCPGCGAPVEFASAQASYAICEFCRSTVLRQGEVLQRKGSMAEVFEDYSPMRIGASGSVERDGRSEPFTLVGRLQLKSRAGVWSEWVAALSDGALGYLSEDNGQFVWSWPWTPQHQIQRFEPREWRLGRSLELGGKTFGVTSVQSVHLLSAQGQLAQLPEPGKPFQVVELRSEQGQVLSLEFDGGPPSLSLGGPVKLADLKMQGLREGPSIKGEQGRHFNCPKCGGGVPVRFSSTKSLSCPSCGSLIDLEQGMGQQLAYAEQHEPVRPSIPMGSKGMLEGLQWQVVGFQHRMGKEPGDDESFGWEEYLLYNQKAGFAFLIDSLDGWSMARVTTGLPQLNRRRDKAKYLKRQYVRESSYAAETTYALGEFYWPVRRGQITQNVDYVSVGERSKAFLSSENEKGEVTWSHGTAVSVTTLSAAFGVSHLLDRSQVGISSGGRLTIKVIFIGLAVLLMSLFAIKACTRTDCEPGQGRVVDASGQLVNQSGNCNSYTRSRGGSWGGFTSGGSHK